MRYQLPSGLWVEDRRYDAPDTKSDRSRAMDTGSWAVASQPRSKFQDFDSYLKAIRIPWVNASCTLVSYTFAKNKYEIVDDSDNVIDDPDNPFLQLMEKPNGQQTGFMFRELQQMYLKLTGNAYITKESRDGNGVPRELYLPNPSRMKIVPAKDGSVKGYVYDAMGQMGGSLKGIPYDADEVIHRRLPNPTDDYYGMGLIEASEILLDIVIAMSEHERGYWQSGGRIIGVLQSEEVLTEEEFDELKREWAAASRDVKQRARTAVLQKGVKYSPIAEGLRSLDITSIDRNKRDQILAIWGVPKTKLGILEDAQYKQEDADKTFQEETMAPDFDRWEDDIQQLIDLYNPDWHWRYERKDFSNDTEKLANANAMASGGLFTVDEGRVYFGADKLPNGNGDVLMISTAYTLVPLSGLEKLAEGEAAAAAGGGAPGAPPGGAPVGADPGAPPPVDPLSDPAVDAGSPPPVLPTLADNMPDPQPTLPTLAAHLDGKGYVDDEPCGCRDCLDVKGDVPGHDFHGNQWTARTGAVGDQRIETYTQIIGRLSEHQKVILASPRQVSTLVDKLAKQANDPKVKAINLCNVSVPGSNVFCVDADTEIMTRKGWKRYTELNVGEDVLTINHDRVDDVPVSEWQPLKAINIFPAMQRSMLSMEGRAHSSLTTGDHRWPIIRGRRHGGHPRRWTTSSDITWEDAIQTAAPCSTVSQVPSILDEVVELVAWTWTDGMLRNKAVRIYQSITKNPDKCAAIRRSLTSLFGPVHIGTMWAIKAAANRASQPAWRETVNETTGMTSFHLNTAASTEIVAAMDENKVVTYEFINSLTAQQLRIFIDRSIDADGHRTKSSDLFSQRSEARIRVFEMACALAGLRTITTIRPEHRPGRKKGLQQFTVCVTRRSSPLVQPKMIRVGVVETDGEVWCPTTPNGTWLARRRGTVFYTGNCSDNQGIHRLQMPQLSGKPTPGSLADSLPKNAAGEADIGPAFVADLQSQGIKVTDEKEPAAFLKASQDELQASKVAGMAGAIANGKMDPGFVYVSKDNYVVDGHHRWAAVIANDARDGVLGTDKGEAANMNIRRVDLPIMDVLARANAFAAAQGIPQASMKSLNVKGDVAGHDFHGNQWGGALPAASSMSMTDLKQHLAVYHGGIGTDSLKKSDLVDVHTDHHDAASGPTAPTQGGGSISRVEAAAVMYGNGSPQHQQAVARWGRSSVGSSSMTEHAHAPEGKSWDETLHPRGYGGKFGQGTIGREVQDMLKDHPVKVAMGWLHQHVVISPKNPNPTPGKKHPDLVAAHDTLHKAGWQSWLRADNKVVAMRPINTADITTGMTPVFGFGGFKAWELLNDDERQQLVIDLHMRNARRQRVIHTMQRKSVKTPMDRVREVTQKSPAASLDTKAARRAHAVHPAIVGAITRGRDVLIDAELEETKKRVREAFDKQRKAITRPQTLTKIVKISGSNEEAAAAARREAIRAALPTTLRDALQPSYERGADKGRDVAMSVLPPASH